MSVVHMTGDGASEEGKIKESSEVGSFVWAVNRTWGRDDVSPDVTEKWERLDTNRRDIV